MTDTRYLTVPQLSKRWDIPVGTIYAWNHRKVGPKYYLFGNHVRYRLTDVEKWEAARVVAA